MLSKVPASIARVDLHGVLVLVLQLYARGDSGYLPVTVDGVQLWHASLEKPINKGLVTVMKLARFLQIYTSPK
jgi:hypothetical protein